LSGTVHGDFALWGIIHNFALHTMTNNPIRPIIITIDGWSSCGKSTLARALATRLGFVYIDSGAMYRAITLYFIRHHIDWTDLDQVSGALQQIELSFHFNPELGRAQMHLNGENVEYLIRDMSVAERVSDVAAIAQVREFAVAQQRRMGKDRGIVMDGRDIGTVVFPDAELKIFMTADNDIRVARRFQELHEKNPDITESDVRTNLETRDHIDSHRDVSPLRQAEDAIVLDNSNITPQEQLDIALQWARERAEKK
jgi:cytidylate kinase